MQFGCYPPKRIVSYCLLPLLLLSRYLGDLSSPLPNCRSPGRFWLCFFFRLLLLHLGSYGLGRCQGFLGLYISLRSNPHYMGGRLILTWFVLHRFLGRGRRVLLSCLFFPQRNCVPLFFLYA